MRRRDFILTGSVAAVAWPGAARTQQPAMPVVGVLGAGAPNEFTPGALLQGLKETGFVEGQNGRVEYRWARGAYERLPALAAELLALRINVLATFGTAAVRVAKSATAGAAAANGQPAVPVVFAFGGDPVAEEIVASFNRPGGNLTGVTSIAGSLAPKRLELLRAVTRADSTIAILINPKNPLGISERKDAETAAQAIDQRLEFLTASDEREIDAAFAALPQRGIGALIVAVDTFYYYGQMARIAALAARYAVPAIGPLRDFAEAGGLMSYGASIFDVNRQAGVYVGKVLKGAEPADLPVLQPTRFELIINLKAAKALGLDLPPTLLALADAVIE
jgi:putative ABC transport system substrate-binding protein